MAKKQGPRWEDLDKSMIDLSVLMQHYEVHNRTEGRSPRTVGWYNEVLGMLIKWLEDGRLPTSIGAINEDIIRQFILYIQERPGINGKLSSHTVANRVRALKAFFAWLDRKGYTRKNLLKELRSPKTVDRVIEPLSKEEVEKIYSGINSNTAMGARNSALVSLMLDTGLRLSEAAYLEEADLHLEERYVKVMGKGGALREGDGEGRKRKNCRIRGGLPASHSSLLPPLPGNARPRWGERFLPHNRWVPNNAGGNKIVY